MSTNLNCKEYLANRAPFEQFGIGIGAFDHLSLSSRPSGRPKGNDRASLANGFAKSRVHPHVRKTVRPLRRADRVDVHARTVFVVSVSVRANRETNAPGPLARRAPENPKELTQLNFKSPSDAQSSPTISITAYRAGS